MLTLCAYDDKYIDKGEERGIHGIGEMTPRERRPDICCPW
jgi:hypothetical protein